MPRVSSITPRPSINVQVTRTAAEWFTRLSCRKNGSTCDAMSAATRPRYIAMPPMVGSGTL